MEISTAFVTVFTVFWLLGPASQLLQLVAPDLHMKIGFMEKEAFKPEFRWFRLYERGTAIADLTYLVAGLAFIALALIGERTALIFGLYTCSIFVFVMVQYLSQVFLLSRENLHPGAKGQLGFYVAYGLAFIGFGLFGLVYLWRLANA